ncbi:enoyl-CoA hydratase/isomerase family protein [Streptomyces coffeae]|uniref:Enoyl-CoA hydratase/isomerase family protein n=1 Tax=Streptomyces coffeae TaxID=621382 RepID=A0ABS1NNG2_9ACTN|nr:enoyl-CoA hydratase/isomerase family protein [Streptomyces coffeae]MBL1101505.1 enoyl-CoA hydratase/isomerase family protein [Streptomyces coffeae]
MDDTPYTLRADTPDRRRPAVTALVELTAQGGVARIVVGDGRRRNALPTSAWTELAHTVERVGRDPATRAVVIRGRGRHFCAGSDLTEWRDAAEAAVEESFTAMESAFTAIEHCPVPVLAEVRGAAAGAGCQLALACDLLYIAESGRIGMPVVRLGILPSVRFAARMAELIGPSLTRELFYTGALLDGAEAARCGLATRAFPDTDLEGAATGLLKRILALPPEAVRAAKHATRLAGRTTPAPRPPTVSPGDFRRAIGTFLDNGDPPARRGVSPAALLPE